MTDDCSQSAKSELIAIAKQQNVRLKAIAQRFFRVCHNRISRETCVVAAAIAR